MSATTQDFSRSREEVEAVVFEVLVYQRQEDLWQDRWRFRGAAIFGAFSKKTSNLEMHHAFIQAAYLGEEFDLLLMWRLLHSTTAHHSLCGERKIIQRLMKRGIFGYTIKKLWAMFIKILWSHSTKMSDELLGDVHPLQEFLEETVGKTLLDGGNILLHVLQTPEDGEYKYCDKEQNKCLWE